MGAFAGMLREAGHRVSGSDRAFYPPMSDALQAWGIETMLGFDPRHLDPRPDLVVVGNVCRADNPEARAAIDAGIAYTSFPGALKRMFLQQRRSFVVAGTHGKTTTSALLSFLLERTGRAPGFLFGGIAADFEHSFRAGAPGGPFVVEGDEYDSAFFEKSPKFWQYCPQVACIHAIEHDHIDIYPDMASYRAAFEHFVELLPSDGVLVIAAGDREVARVADRARCPRRSFALADEPGADEAEAVARVLPPSETGQPFELVLRGRSAGRFESQLPGRHNLRNALAALLMAHEGEGVPLSVLADALPAFRGVKRRQELRGVARGVRVYDDFAHHPTAVEMTLAALRERHPRGRLWAVFEPRSATASRRIHQAAYATAFEPADRVVLSPVGRPEIAASERLDVEQLARELNARGKPAQAAPSVEAIVARIAAEARAGDSVVIMSNGAFGEIHDKLLAALAQDA